VTPIQHVLSSHEWLVASSAVIATWAVATTGAAIAKTAKFDVPAPDVGVTTVVAAALFIITCYLPFGLTGAHLALKPGSALRLWLVLAPALSLAIAIVAVAGLIKRFLLKRTSQDASLAELGLHVVVAALIVANSFWVLAFDEFMRD